MNSILMEIGRPLGLPISAKRKLYFDPTPIIASAAATQNAIIGGLTSLSGSNSAVADSRSARDYDNARYNVEKLWHLYDMEQQRKENQTSRDYATEMLEKEMAFQHAQNSPAAQVAALIAAGLNPAAVFGQVGSGGQIGSSPSASYSPLSLPSGQYGTSMAGLTFSRSQAIQSYGDMVAKFLQAGVDQTHLWPDIQKVMSETAKNVAETEKTDVEIKAVQLDTNIKAMKAPKEIEKLSRDISLLISQGKLVDANAALVKMQEKIADVEWHVKQETKDALVAQAKELVELTKEQQKTEKAKQAEHFAGAEEKRQTAQTEKELREWKVLSARSVAKLDDLHQRIENNPQLFFEQQQKYQEELRSDINKALANSAISEKQKKEAEVLLSRLKSLENERNNIVWFQWLDDALSWFSGLVGIGLNGSVSSRID